MKAARIIGVLVGATALVLPLIASADSCPNLTRSLGKGSSGSDVLALQKFLVNDGDLLSDNTTGYFGVNTEEGVQRFQTRNRIVMEGSATSTGFGYVGPKTRAAIAQQCPSSQASATQASYTFPSASNDTTQQTTSQSSLGKCPIVPLPTGVCSTGWLARPGKDGCIRSWLCIAPLSGSASDTATSSTDTTSATNLTLTNSSSTVALSGNQPPIILSVSGPITLVVGKTGTWTIHAVDPEGGALEYRFNWGDTSSAFNQIAGIGASYSSTPTDSYSYSTAGIYTAIFSVGDGAGNVTQSAAQITVTDSTASSGTSQTGGSGTASGGGTTNQNFGSYGGGVLGAACAYEGQQSFTACPYMANCNGGTYLTCHNGVWTNQSADQYACADPKPCVTRPNGMILCVARNTDGTCPLF